MDLKGQRLCEALCFYLVLATTVGAFAAGVYTQSLKNLFLVYAGGVSITFLVGVPNYPWYNRHPLKWLDPIEQEQDEAKAN
jgi:signal peptidase complex subunit 1